MQGPSFTSEKGRKRRSRPVKTAMSLAREYAGINYQPAFGLGIICRDEADQQALYQRLSGLLEEREIKVLVI